MSLVLSSSLPLFAVDSGVWLDPALMSSYVIMKHGGSHGSHVVLLLTPASLSASPLTPGQEHLISILLPVSYSGLQQGSIREEELIYTH